MVFIIILHGGDTCNSVKNNNWVLLIINNSILLIILIFKGCMQNPVYAVIEEFYQFFFVNE